MAITKIMIMRPATDTIQILQTPDRFIMNIIPIEFGPMPDRSDQGAAQRFIRKEHEPVGRVFMQYRAKSAGEVMRCRDRQHNLLEILKIIQSESLIVHRTSKI